jgi:hypothetical protein
MRKLWLPVVACVLVGLFSTKASATANFVYHEQTNNFVATPTCPSGGTDTSCGRFLENTDRSGSAGFQIFSPETYTLHFKVEFQFFTNQVRIYYTTDGSNPSGSFGTPFGTTQVAVASYTCTYSDQTQSCQVVDVVTGTIPPQPAGTTVKYIVSAFHSGGGPEIFGNSGTCNGCFSCQDSTTGCATIFQYNVIAPPSTPLIISEFRLNGPGPSGATPTQQASDEFIEIYNNGNSDVTVNAFDGSAGFALAAADGITRFVIPNGTVIPGRGHYLGVNSVGYSLAAYPAGNGTTATGDATYTNDIATNVGIALFNTANPANFTLANRLDAAGSTSEANTLYKEGAGYPAISILPLEYSFYRSLCSFVSGVGCTTPGTPKDTNNNSADFLFIDTQATAAGAGTRLGAPGPENLSSPIQHDDTIPVDMLDRSKSSSSAPNRVRDFTSDGVNNSSSGTLSFRRRVTNNTGSNVTRLRFRVVEITTFPPPSGTAWLVARTSGATVVSGITDAGTCGVLPQPCAVTVQGTTLETPPAQPNGGAFNSSLSAGTVALATPLAPGASINLQFLVGLQQTGSFRFLINVEALP